MKLLAVVVFTMLLGLAGAKAQAVVPPQWNYAGSAVCPEGYDFFEGWCRARGSFRVPRRGRHFEPGYDPGYSGPGYGRSYRGRGYDGRGYSSYGGVPPRWNRRGSAVCPNGYDYYAHTGLCLPRR